MTLKTPADAGNCCGCVADGVTILGNGSPSNPFRAVGGSGGGGGSSPTSAPIMQDFIEGATPNFQVITGGGVTKVALVDSGVAGPAGWAKTPVGVALLEVDGTIPNAQVYIDVSSVTGHSTPPATIFEEIDNDINAGKLTMMFRFSWSGDDQNSGAGNHSVFAFGQYTKPASGFASFWNLVGFGIGKDVFGTNTWWALTGNAGAGIDGLVQHNTGVAVDNSSLRPHVFKIVYDPAGPSTTWFIDNVQVAIDNTLQGGSLLPSANLKAAAGGAGQTVLVYADYIYCDPGVDRSTT